MPKKKGRQTKQELDLADVKDSVEEIEGEN